MLNLQEKKNWTGCFPCIFVFHSLSFFILISRHISGCCNSRDSILKLRVSSFHVPRFCYFIVSRWFLFVFNWWWNEIITATLLFVCLLRCLLIFIIIVAGKYFWIVFLVVVGSKILVVCSSSGGGGSKRSKEKKMTRKRDCCAISLGSLAAVRDGERI